MGIAKSLGNKGADLIAQELIGASDPASAKSVEATAQNEAAVGNQKGPGLMDSMGNVISTTVRMEALQSMRAASLSSPGALGHDEVVRRATGDFPKAAAYVENPLVYDAVLENDGLGG